MLERSFVVGVYGNVSQELCEKIENEIKLCQINRISPNDIIKFDNAIYEDNALIISSDQKDKLSFITAYLAEWRVLDQNLQKNRPVIIDNRDGFFNSIFEALEKYRANLPDEKNPEAKNWFVYPTKKLTDFFVICNSDEEIISAFKKILENQFELKKRNSLSQDELKKLSEKFPKAKISESHEQYRSVSENKKSGIFVPTFACDNEYLKDLAKLVGETIAKLGFKFINGGPDGGRNANGPMHDSALAAILAGADVLSIYSYLILNKYVSPEKMDQFEGISILTTLSEGERKQIMLDESAAVIALPGAIGTLAEIEDALRLGKPVILVDDKSIHNGQGFWKIHLDHFKRIGLEDKIAVVYNGENFALEIIRALRSMNVIFPKDVKTIQKSDLYQRENNVASLNNVQSDQLNERYQYNN